MLKKLIKRLKRVEEPLPPAPAKKRPKPKDKMVGKAKDK